MVQSFLIDLEHTIQGCRGERNNFSRIQHHNLFKSDIFLLRFLASLENKPWIISLNNIMNNFGPVSCVAFIYLGH